MTTNGKIAVITGAARGIGLAIALALGQRGDTVVLIDVDREALAACTVEMHKTGIEVMTIPADVSNPTEVQTIVQTIQNKFGSVDILVNNAGITRDSLFLRMKSESWQRVLEVNLNAVFLLTKELIRGMLKKRWGRIINISSVVAFMGNPGQTNYAASKAALLGFTRSLAREVAKRGITVNAVAPGFIDTDMTASLPENVKEAMLKAIPLKKYGTPQDIAHAVLFLASGEADYITGQVLHVNGGLYM